MFSGIIEALVPALSGEARSGLYRLRLVRPREFTDLKSGDSIAVNGVCLTIETFDEASMVFALAAETLKILRWDPSQILDQRYNLERSLRFGDRIHGHLVSGHVEAMGTVVGLFEEGESLHLKVSLPKEVLPFLWRKGSLTLNGVSLTVNELIDSLVVVCLIPETRKRTNLGDLKIGDLVTLETDQMARAMLRLLESGILERSRSLEVSS